MNNIWDGLTILQVGRTYEKAEQSREAMRTYLYALSS